MRIRSYREVLSAEAESLGYDTACLKKQPPSHAHWRWDTLNDCIQYILPCLIIFEMCWPWELFKSSRKRKLEVRTRSTAQSTEWKNRFYVVGDICTHIHALRTWGSGCPCHEQQRREGKAISCSNQGKRLPEVVPRLKIFCQECDEAAEAPEPHHLCFGKTLPADLEEHRSFGFTHLATVTREQSMHYDQHPESLSQIENTIDLHLHLVDWRNAPRKDRHRCTNYLFEGSACESGCFRS